MFLLDPAKHAFHREMRARVDVMLCHPVGA